jgi:hypothetical protein
MTRYKMNRYHQGSSTIVASRFGSAHVGAQLKVENPVPLRTIWNFDLLPSARACLSLQRNAYLRRGFDQKSIKNQNLAVQCRWRHEHCTQKERPAWREEFHRRERRRSPGCGYVRKRHRQKSQVARGRDYGSINFPLAALIAASVRVAAPSLPRALSV